MFELKSIVQAHERAGDISHKHHLYEDAAQHYQDALKIETLETADRLRIWEKIGRAFFLNGDSAAANPWFDRVLAEYVANPQDASKSVEILLQITRQLSLDYKIETARSVIMRAMQIAEVSGNIRLSKLVNLRMAHYLQLLGRYEEAADILRAAGRVTDGDDASLGSYYLSRCAAAATVTGNAEEAYRNFESAIQLAKGEADPYRITLVWGNYAAMAKELGDTNRAKACYEQALLVVRQYQISLWIPLLCLSYADLLACMGQSHTAHEYLLEALSSTARAPSLDMNFAGVGIPIALQMGDEAALVKCARSTVIELAFESGRPGAIGNMACAFAQLYASQGRGNAARALLHRALEKIHNVHDNLDLTIEIARQGALSDVSSARALLEKRVHLPHADVFQAGLALFDACVEQRGDNHRKAHTHARNAAERFTALQWYGRAELAHSMIPNKGYTEPPAVLHGKPFSHMQQALTPREQEVAALALKGFTNRTIATELSIAPHTVEKYMNSIMNRLGIRSRHQLTDVLDNPPEA